uniref:Leukemia inhibitory factor n=1 Tax=Dromaius novaehollandiae TaxID=8790 RepID=A0A8C4JV32_DRONO
MAEDAQELFIFYVSVGSPHQCWAGTAQQGHCSPPGLVPSETPQEPQPEAPSRSVVTALLVSLQESHQNMNKLCQKTKWVEWLPQADVADLLAPGVLQELYGAMEHMDHALQTILQHQQDLNAPGAELLQRLTATHLKVRGLLNNIEVLLRARGITPVHVTLPQKPAVTKVFQQKLEGCKVLWIYSQRRLILQAFHVLTGAFFGLQGLVAARNLQLKVM